MEEVSLRLAVRQLHDLDGVVVRSAVVDPLDVGVVPELAVGGGGDRERGVHHAGAVGLELREGRVVGAVVEAGEGVEGSVAADHLVQVVAAALAPAALDVVGLLDELGGGAGDIADEEALGAAWVPAVACYAVLAEGEPALFSVDGCCG